MKIKNTLTAVGVAGVLGSTIFTGCDAMEDDSISNDTQVEETISYEAFSQTISQVVDISSNKITQLDGHLGYQPVAISLESYGGVVGFLDGGCIYFINNEDVFASTNQFGSPISSTQDVDVEEFLPYQHILLVPYTTSSNF